MTSYSDACEFPELDHLAYLTGVSTTYTRAAHRDDLGMLTTPASSIHRQRTNYRYWAADNGCYMERHPTKGRPFDEERWMRMLAECGPEGALFVTMPDVLNWVENPDETKRSSQPYVPVGDMAATWARSERYIDTVQALGFPVAIVLQDGLEDLPDVWAAILDRADAVFVGGSDAWKLGVAARFVREAREHGLWVHVGRVNSLRRCRLVQAMGADSADGTFIGYGPSVNGPKVVQWLETLAHSERPTFVPAARPLAA